VNWTYFLKLAWTLSPAVALNIPDRFIGVIEDLSPELKMLCLSQPHRTLNLPGAASLFLQASVDRELNAQRVKSCSLTRSETSS
jgi:hypothetical protein